MANMKICHDQSRRDFLKLSAAGVLGTSMSGWMNVLASRAAASGVKHKSCILLWMDGGPSHLDTFDLKPEAPDTIRGEFRPIATSVPGIHISEHFPKLAKLMHHAALIRSMSTGEAEHERARYYVHTGYKPGRGLLEHPSVGSIVSAALGEQECLLPNFVVINGRVRGALNGAGFLGARHQPLVVPNPGQSLPYLKSVMDSQQLANRVGLLEDMERRFFRDYQATSSGDHHTTYQRAFQLLRSPEARAFDLSQEPAAVRAAYGAGPFGEGCLLARRLVETGVPFIEVTRDGWDTHKDNFSQIKRLSTEVDPAMSALVQDLKERNLLDSTLIIWMGEFGRTPRLEDTGRNHYARAWSTVLMGGGIKAGQVVGKTDREGAVVTERPVSAIDFLATVCHLLGIDHTATNSTADGRPIRIVDKGAKPIQELW